MKWWKVDFCRIKESMTGNIFLTSYESLPLWPLLNNIVGIFCSSIPLTKETLVGYFVYISSIPISSAVTLSPHIYAGLLFAYLRFHLRGIHVSI
jgi:hypothetical protein